MRTTLNLSDALVDAAKRRAGDEGRTLTSFIEEAMRRQLQATNSAPSRPMPTFGEPGGPDAYLAALCVAHGARLATADPVRSQPE